MRKVTQRTLVGAGAVIVAGVVVGAVALGREGSSGGSGVDTSGLTGASAEVPPAAPRSAVVLAREAGSRAVALAVVPGARPGLTATILGPSGGGESGLHVSFRLGSGTTIRGRSCGLGCYSARAPKGASASQVAVLLPGGPATFRFPATSGSAGRIVARATRVFRGLRTLVFVESLRSGPTGGIVTTWRLAAPDRLTYDIRGGASAVVIGERRWDRNGPNEAWVRSQQIPALSVPSPTWATPVDHARLLGTGRLDGRPVWIVSFADSNRPAWFTAWIDRHSYRTLQLRMAAGAHFMFHRYESFDRRLRITPPKS